MSKYESYASRHNRQGRQEPRAMTPNPIAKAQTKDHFTSQLSGKASKLQVSLLNERLLEMEGKMTNLTSIIKLVQKYTETQDIQFEKQKRVYEGKQSVLNGLIADHETIMKKQQYHLYELEQTHRALKQHSIDSMVEQMAESIRREMNMKIQICMNQIKAPLIDTSYRGSERQELQERIDRLEEQINIKYASKKQLVDFRNNTKEEMVHVIEKFTRLVKKYIAGNSKSESKQATQITNHSIDKPTARMLNKQSEQNIHPNKLRSKSKQVLSEKSLQKQRPKQTSLPKTSKSPKNSPLAKITDKRKEKQQQLKQMIKNTKQKRVR